MEKFHPQKILKSGHLQTLLPWLLRRKLIFNYQTKRLELPDGDFLDLFFTRPYQNQRVVLALAGLQGCHNSSYLLGLSKFFAAKKNYSLVVMNHRGCGYEENRFLPSYHAGKTDDLDFVLKYLQKKAKIIFTLGFSLGGNILLKWLGENPHQKIVSAAVAISTSFKLYETGLYTKKKNIYHNYLLRLLKKALLKKSRNFSIVGIEKLARVKNIFDFDKCYTAPINGFQSIEDYYKKSSCYGYLQKINIPTLLLQAKNDPLIPTSTLPKKTALAAQTILELSDSGGHVGFVYWKHTKGICFWLEEKIFLFIEKFCCELQKKFPKVRCQTCGLVFSTKPVRLRYRAKDWRKCQNKCDLQPT